MTTVGPGVREIRVREESGVYRVIYVTKLEDAIYVLHCSQKKTQKTSKADLALATRRYSELMKGVEVIKRERFASVWDAIEGDPVVAENLKLRSALMLALTQSIRRQGLTQAEAARVLGVTQPRVSNLLHGKINAFSLDLLVKMATAAGLRVSMKIKKVA